MLRRYILLMLIRWLQNSDEVNKHVVIISLSSEDGKLKKITKTDTLEIRFTTVIPFFQTICHFNEVYYKVDAL